MKTPAEAGERIACIDEEINPAAWARVRGHIDQQRKLVDALRAIHTREANAAGWRVLSSRVRQEIDGRVTMRTHLEAA